MDKEALEEAVQDILEYVYKPGRMVTAGRRLAPIWLHVAPDQKSDTQAYRLVELLDQRIKHLLAVRRRNPAQSESGIQSEEDQKQRIIQDTRSKDKILRNLSVLWVHYYNQWSRPSIGESVDRSDRTIDDWIRDGFDYLVAAIRRDLPPPPPSWVELYRDDYISERQFTPIDHLSIGDELQGFVDWTGIRWRTAFAFTGALVSARGKSKEEIINICDRFADFNNNLYRHPELIKITWISKMLAFTMSGLLCFVFEDGGAAQYERLLTELQRPAETFTMGADQVGVQTKATTLFWMLDVPTKRLYRHLGKQPPKFLFMYNNHVRCTLDECAEIETILKKRL